MRRALLFPVAAFAIASAFGACTFETIEDHPCPQGGTTLTYENFGKAFFAENCNSCHSSTNGERNGAPDDFSFETLDEIHEHKDRIFVRAADANDSMPPGPDDPPLADREKLADWLACGAP